MVADITKQLPFHDNSVVVFVSCVLEYVDDVDAAIKELMRISGGHLYVVRVEPWTATAYLYPGAKRTLPETLCRIP
jgi:ubiquinone/menaquinone biosynthesis C-methylase UbiE